MTKHEIGSHKTSIRTEEGQTIVRYHNTDVVKFNCCFITLNTGGWDTATTKVRMNQTSNQFNLNYKVVQKNFEWFAKVEGKALADGIYEEEGLYKFEGNRVVFPRDGACGHE